MTALLSVLAAIVAAVYLGAPILVRSQFRFNVSKSMHMLEISDMPPEVYQYFGETAATLEACGFKLAAYLWSPDYAPNVASYVALWLNPMAGQTADAIVLQTKYPQQTTCCVDFSTQFADGLTVETSNARALPTFKSLPLEYSLYAESVPRLEALYALHLFREHKLAGPAVVRYLPREGKEAASFSEAFETRMRRQAQLGLLYESEPGVYRQTWRGAYRMTWGELPPVKQIRRLLQRARVRRELRESQAHPAAPPQKVRITHEPPYRTQSAPTTARWFCG